jgi:DNA repair ATPase RecN
MHLSGLSRDALRRLQKFAQWEVDESGQAVPMGTPEAQGAPGGDVENRLSTLEQMIKEYGATFQEWVDYLSQYNKGLADSLSAIWTDVNTIGNDVDQLRQEKQQTALQTTPQTKTKPKNKAWDTYTQTAEKTK